MAYARYVAVILDQDFSGKTNNEIENVLLRTGNDLRYTEAREMMFCITNKPTIYLCYMFDSKDNLGSKKMVPMIGLGKLGWEMSEPVHENIIPVGNWSKREQEIYNQSGKKFELKLDKDDIEADIYVNIVEFLDK
jgi:hypothetical protein